VIVADRMSRRARRRKVARRKSLHRNARRIVVALRGGVGLSPPFRGA